ncbi:MAG: hypothetical protein WDO68_04170 [Gammaproteobacteria bacterium]
MLSNRLVVGESSTARTRSTSAAPARESQVVPSSDDRPMFRPGNVSWLRLQLIVLQNACAAVDLPDGPGTAVTALDTLRLRLTDQHRQFNDTIGAGQQLAPDISLHADHQEHLLLSAPQVQKTLRDTIAVVADVVDHAGRELALESADPPGPAPEGAPPTAAATRSGAWKRVLTTGLIILAGIAATAAGVTALLLFSPLAPMMCGLVAVGGVMATFVAAGVYARRQASQQRRQAEPDLLQQNRQQTPAKRENPQLQELQQLGNALLNQLSHYQRAGADPSTDRVPVHFDDAVSEHVAEASVVVAGPDAGRDPMVEPGNVSWLRGQLGSLHYALEDARIPATDPNTRAGAIRVDFDTLRKRLVREHEAFNKPVEDANAQPEAGVNAESVADIALLADGTMHLLLDTPQAQDSLGKAIEVVTAIADLAAWEYSRGEEEPGQTAHLTLAGQAIDLLKQLRQYHHPNAAGPSSGGAPVPAIAAATGSPMRGRSIAQLIDEGTSLDGHTLRSLQALGVNLRGALLGDITLAGISIAGETLASLAEYGIVLRGAHVSVLHETGIDLRDETLDTLEQKGFRFKTTNSRNANNSRDATNLGPLLGAGVRADDWTITELLALGVSVSYLTAGQLLDAGVQLDGEWLSRLQANRIVLLGQSLDRLLTAGVLVQGKTLGELAWMNLAGVSLPRLLNAGVSLRGESLQSLREKGFNPDAIDPRVLVRAGMAAPAERTLEELQAAGVPLNGMTFRALRTLGAKLRGIRIEKLESLGVKMDGAALADLLDAGVDLHGLTLKQLVSAKNRTFLPQGARFTALIAAGVIVSDTDFQLLSDWRLDFRGTTLGQLLAAQVSVTGVQAKLLSANRIDFSAATPSDLLDAGLLLQKCTPLRLHTDFRMRPWADGLRIGRMTDAGMTVQGYTVAKLEKLGYALRGEKLVGLLRAGLNLEMSAEGVIAEGFDRTGCTLSSMIGAGMRIRGYTVPQLKELGYTLKGEKLVDLLAAGLNLEMSAEGVIAEGFDRTGCTLSSMIGAGMRIRGYTVPQLKELGYTFKGEKLVDLLAAGLILEMLAEGVIAEGFDRMDCTLSSMMGAGMRIRGYTVPRLKELGYTFKGEKLVDLLAAGLILGVTADGVVAEGFDMTGCTEQKLIDAGLLPT